ncbi:MAG: rod shape-determining protein [Clostridia bacterium]|nr:rod shape-determining protein [Clostridia bacterium]
MAQIVGLDLGTAYTRIWLDGKGIILRCPSAVAMDSQTHDIVAVGEKARMMLGKTPEDILAYSPVKDGTIADFQAAAGMVNEFFYNKHLSSLFNRPTVIVTEPYSINEVESLAVENAVLAAGARSVAQIPAVYAAAVGAGLNVSSPRGCMIVNIGAGRAEAAIISSCGIIRARSMKLAGEKFDMAISNYLKKNMGILVGDRTAHKLKINVGTALPSIDRGYMTVHGQNDRTKLPLSLDVHSSHVSEALLPCIEAISRMIMSTFDGAPPEIIGDIYNYGFMLSGGSALLPGLPEVLSKKTGLRVTVAKNPRDTVVEGLGTLIAKPYLYGDSPQFKIK